MKFFLQVFHGYLFPNCVDVRKDQKQIKKEAGIGKFFKFTKKKKIGRR